MGMFDRLYDATGHEWQTKALGRALNDYDLGAAIPRGPFTYQLEVIGGGDDRGEWAHADVRDGLLTAIPVARDETLPLLQFAGTWRRPTKAT
jgi:hypothetical protein